MACCDPARHRRRTERVQKGDHVEVSTPYAGKRILVTGAGGFIGSHLCRQLCSGGADVHAVSRVERGASDRKLTWWKGDLADTAWVQHASQEIRPEIIFHLASEVTGARGLDLVIPTLRCNLVSTVNLLTSAAELGCRRIVLAGSLEEPEWSEDGIVPCSPYAAAKSSSTLYASMFHSLYQLSVVTLRLFMVYGPAQKDLQKLVPYVVSSLLRSEAPKLSSGTRLVDWIYVEDVVEALLAAGQSEGIAGLTIDIGSGSLTSIRRVVELLAEAVGTGITPLFGAIPDRAFERHRVADLDKAKALLGWAPKTSLPDGLRRTVEWYESHLDDIQAGLLPSQVVAR